MKKIILTLALAAVCASCQSKAQKAGGIYADAQKELARLKPARNVHRSDIETILGASIRTEYAPLAQGLNEQILKWHVYKLKKLISREGALNKIAESMRFVSVIKVNYAQDLLQFSTISSRDTQAFGAEKTSEVQKQLNTTSAVDLNKRFLAESEKLIEELAPKIKALKTRKASAKALFEQLADCAVIQVERDLGNYPLHQSNMPGPWAVNKHGKVISLVDGLEKSENELWSLSSEWGSFTYQVFLDEQAPMTSLAQFFSTALIVRDKAGTLREINYAYYPISSSSKIKPTALLITAEAYRLNGKNLSADELEPALVKLRRPISINHTEDAKAKGLIHLLMVLEKINPRESQYSQLR